MATLIKIDKNGSKHYEGMVTCPKCGGVGLIAHHVENGVPSWNWTDGGVCWKCGGEGKILGKWIERTPEYQAKLDAKRQAKLDKIEAEWQAKKEAERLAQEAEEARIKAQKAISQHVGKIGERITVNVTFQYCAEWQTKFGWQTLYTFKDADGNVFTWKTSSVPEALNEKGEDVIINKGDWLQITGTVKDHTEYKDEKQTVLTRCKLFTRKEG